MKPKMNLLTETQKEMNCNLLEDAIDAKSLENALSVEKGTSFNHIAKKPSAKNCRVKEVTKEVKN